MSRRRSPILLLVTAVILVISAWFVITPRRAWQQFLRALAQQDSAALAVVVDTEALRAHAATDLAAAMADQAKVRTPAPATRREDLVNQIVESMVSPAGLRQMVTSFSTPAGNGQDVRTAFHYHGLSQVDVLLGGSDANETGAGLFTFERHGMRWQLVRASSQRVAKLTTGS